MVRRHPEPALPERLEESAQLALHALERVLPCANRLLGTCCVHSIDKLATAATARATGLGATNVKALRRHSVSALPECLEEAVQLALRALGRVTLCESMAGRPLRI